MHSPIRLSILAVLAEVDAAEFGFVAETVEINAATLSKQMTILHEAGHIHIHKRQVGRRSKTWLSLSDHGRQSFAEYLTALRAITGAVSTLIPHD